MEPKFKPLTFVCAICGEVATRIGLLPPEATTSQNPTDAKETHADPKPLSPAYLYVDGVVCNSQFRVMDYRWVSEAMVAGDFVALYEIDPEYVPSYCSQCQKHYCREHWKQSVRFDDGHYDYTNGVCPAGHRRVLAD